MTKSPSPGERALVFKGGYKKIVIGSLFSLCTRVHHLGMQKHSKLEEKGILLTIFTTILKVNDVHWRKTCKNIYLGSNFIPGWYVLRVCFQSPFTRMTSNSKYRCLPGPQGFLWGYRKYNCEPYVKNFTWGNNRNWGLLFWMKCTSNMNCWPSVTQIAQLSILLYIAFVKLHPHPLWV